MSTYTPDELLALSDAELALFAFDAVERIEYRDDWDHDKLDPVYAALEEILERFAPEARWANVEPTTPTTPRRSAPSSPRRCAGTYAHARAPG